MVIPNNMKYSLSTLVLALFFLNACKEEKKNEVLKEETKSEAVYTMAELEEQRTNWQCLLLKFLTMKP